MCQLAPYLRFVCSNNARKNAPCNECQWSRNWTDASRHICSRPFCSHVLISCTRVSEIKQETHPHCPRRCPYNVRRRHVCVVTGMREQVAAVLTAKGRIAADTYRITSAHAVYSLYFAMGRKTIRYDTRCYINVRSKASMSQLNLPHGIDN